MAVKDETEWMKQAEHDLKAAETNCRSGLNVFAIFLCHLSIEKALKAVYFKRHDKQPPKVHNLLFFIENCELLPPDDMYNFLYMLNGASIPTRYPDELSKLYEIYDKRKTKEIIKKSKEVLKWVNESL